MAEVVSVPSYYGGAALPVEVVGFLAWEGERPANLLDIQRVSPASAERIDGRRTAFVGGTSAESGKTTAVCALLQRARRRAPGVRFAGLKACGTGRLRDMLRYDDAGAAYSGDFVDAGWPSTYNISTGDYHDILRALVAEALSRADAVLIELGGDLLEAQAPEALKLASAWGAPIMLCVNDAMGAVAGLNVLRAQGIGQFFFATIRQNPRALAERLNVPFVVDPQDATQLDALIFHLLPGVSRGIRPTEAREGV